MTDPKTTYQFEADIRDLMSKMDRIQKEFDDTKKAGAGAGAGIGSSFESLGGVIAGVTAALSSLYVVYQGLATSVETAAEFEALQTRLTSLYGSVEKGTAAFEDFKRVAATTPYSVKQVVEAGAQLEAFGASARKNIKPIADLAAFMGIDIVEAASAFGRAMAGGVGAADILRERGVLQLVKSFRGIDDLTKLTLPEFRKALQETIEDPAGKIAGSTDRLSKTFTGAVSNMYDALDQVANLVGSRMLPALTGMARMVSDFAGNILPSATVAIEKERIEFNSLIGVLTSATTAQEQRNMAIRELQDKYGSYLGNLDLEKASLDDIAKATEQANKQFETKIRLIAAEEKLTEIKKRQSEEEWNLFQAQKRTNASLAERNFAMLAPSEQEGIKRRLLNTEEALREKVNAVKKEYQEYYDVMVMQGGIEEEWKKRLEKSKGAADNLKSSVASLFKELTQKDFDKKPAEIILDYFEKQAKKQKELKDSFEASGQAHRQFKNDVVDDNDYIAENFKNLQSQIENISQGFVEARMNGQDMGEAIKKALEQILAKAVALSIAFAVMQLIPGGAAASGGFGGFIAKGFGFNTGVVGRGAGAGVLTNGGSLQKSAPVQVVLQGTLQGQEFFEKSTVAASNNFSSRTF